MAPTLVASRTALAPEGAAAPAAWQSQFRGPCLRGGVAPTAREEAAPPAVRQSRACGRNLGSIETSALPAALGALRTLAFGTIQ